MAQLDTPTRRRGTPLRRDLGWVVPASAVAAVMARLPFVGLPPGADEAGFLQVAAQWSAGSGSLYGHYWVDRPPVLIMLFQVAHAAGGVVALRLLGCGAALAVVLLCAWAAGQVGGRRSARWAAVVAAAMTASPLIGALEVNGELLAAPFVALGIGATVAAVRSRAQRPTLGWGSVAGGAAILALLVKQNTADVIVFGTALLVVGLATRAISQRRAVHVVTGAVTGGLTVVVLVGLWTAVHGTSVPDVLYAMYPFRLEAASVVASGGSQYAMARLGHVALAWFGSGLALLTVCLLLTVVRMRLRRPVVVALGVTALFDVASIAMGGAYWLHYLVQAAVPVSIAIGIAAAQRGRVLRPLVRVAVGFSAVATLAGALATAWHPPRSDAQDIGRAIAAASRPGDTLTTLYGEADVNFAAGLSSPYEYLWSLPIKTLDPRLTELNALLESTRAPTWLVTSHRIASWGLDATDTQLIVADRYRLVATIHGQGVYLLDDAQRPTPVASSSDS